MWPLVSLAGICLAALVASGFLPEDNPTAGRIYIVVSTLLAAVVTILYTRYQVERKVDEVRTEIEKISNKQETDNPS